MLTGVTTPPIRSRSTGSSMTSQTADVMVNAVKRQSNSKSNRTVHEWRDRMRFEEMKRYLTDDKQLEQAEEYIQAIKDDGDHESMYKLAQKIYGFN